MIIYEGRMARIDLIKPEEIYQLFTSTKFRRALKESGNYVYTTGYESAFDVVRDINKLFHLSSIVKAKLASYSIDGRLEKTKFNHGLHEDVETYPFLDFHFHTDSHEATGPSFEDLTGHYAGCSGEWKKIILGIGQIFENRDIHIILIQKKREIGENEFRDLTSNLEEISCKTKNREVAEFFRKSGLYNSEVLPYRYVQKGRLHIPQFNQRDVAQFSYSVNLDDILL